MGAAALNDRWHFWIVTFFPKRSTLMPYAGYYLLCHIYKINIIKISWISAFYSYLNLKYFHSAFRMNMLWRRVTISSGSCQPIPMIQIRQKMWLYNLIGRKISRFYVTLNLVAFQFKVVMYQSCAASEWLIEKQRFFPEISHFVSQFKKIYTLYKYDTYMFKKPI